MYSSFRTIGLDPGSHHLEEGDEFGALILRVSIPEVPSASPWGGTVVFEIVVPNLSGERAREIQLVLCRFKSKNFVCFGFRVHFAQGV